jgi:hypothetical protein
MRLDRLQGFLGARAEQAMPGRKPVEDMPMILLLLILGFLGAAAPVSASPIQGPVRGTVELADGAQVNDIVVQVRCLTHGIHNTSWPADEVSRIVGSGESFLIPWAFRGVAPAGCSLQVFHPRYVVARRPLDRQFSQQVGVIRLESWHAFMDQGPKPPPMPSHYPWPATEFRDHLNTLLYYYIPAFSEGPKRKAIGQHIPRLHSLFKRVLATGAFGPWPSTDRTLPIETLRQIQKAVSYPASQSALFDAVSRNDATRVAELVKAGAYLDGWDDEGRTPLFLAARAGHTECAVALVEGGAQIDLPRHTEPRTAVSAALSDRHWKTAAALMARGASAPPVDGPYRQWFVNALYSLSYQGDIASLRVFLDAGISPNLAESSGVTPLMGAAKGNQYEAGRMLIDAGADVNARASHNRTALGIAKAGRFTKLVELLEQAGARD